MATRSNFAYKKEFVIKVTKVLCYFFCIVMFLVLMGDVWDKFNDGITTIGLVEKNLNGNNQSLPCLTFCPEQGFKQRGLYFQEDQYMKQTFNKTDLLPSIPLGSKYDCSPVFHEIRSPHLGRCHVVCFQTMSSSNNCILVSNKDLDLTMFSHKMERSHRIVTANLENELSSLNIIFRQETGAFQITIAERWKSRLNKKSRKCKDYSKEVDYDKCIKDNVRSIMGNSVKCQLPGFEEFLPINSTLNGCSNRTEAIDAIAAFKNVTFFGKTVDCLEPCFSIYYPMTMRHAHKNTLIDVNGEKTDEFMDKYKFLIFEFKTQQIVEEIETYIYDYVGLLTAIGGNLGLLLGFSCLSIMLEILDKIARINVKKSF